MKNLTCLKIHISPHIIPASGRNFRGETERESRGETIDE